jgi:hypothetical protein
MAPQLITGCKHDGFIRIFNHGDQDGFAYNMGGRLYSKASGVSYQNLKKRYRHDMRINGKPVVELDLRGSFPTILYALHGIQLNTDPYLLNGLPREVAKAWINMTLGYDRFHSSWPEETATRMREKKGIDLNANFDIRSVRASVIEEHPILASWPSSPYRWQHFQFLESSAIIDAIEELGLTYDVTALALHDALLVPLPEIAVATAVLANAFRERVGVDPVLTVKDSWGVV